MPCPRSRTVIRIAALQLVRPTRRLVLPLLGHVRHRVHGVEQEVDEHLLDLDRVTDHVERAPLRAAIQAVTRRWCASVSSKFTASLSAALMSKPLPFGLMLREQCSQPADNFAGTQIVAADTRHDAVQVLAPISARLQNQVRGIGARKNRAERLIDFVGNRGRQLASDCQPRRVCEFGALSLHRKLRVAATAALDEQSRDQQRLQYDDCDGRGDRVVVRLPERRLLEINDCIRWNLMLVDAPAPHLPPVDAQHRRGGGRQLQ